MTARLTRAAPRASLARRVLGALVLVATSATAQYADLDRADWQEDALPPPPSYDASRLIDIEMPSASTVKLGVDPETIRVNTKTGIVRYVVVARGPAAVNASYEGIRCDTGEFRIYARQVQGGAWTPSDDSEWRPMAGQSSVMVRHPYKLARGGMCIGTAVRPSALEIVRELKTGNQSLYY